MELKELLEVATMFDASIVNELMDENAVEQALKEIRATIQKENVIFSLSGPQQLSVKRKGGYYSESHIGGEDFVLSDVYIGKRRALIYVFKPVGAASYEQMEMNETVAKRALIGFGTWSSGNEFQKIIRNAKRAMNNEADQEKAAGQKDVYGNEWGGW